MATSRIAACPLLEWKLHGHKTSNVLSRSDQANLLDVKQAESQHQAEIKQYTQVHQVASQARFKQCPIRIQAVLGPAWDQWKCTSDDISLVQTWPCTA